MRRFIVKFYALLALTCCLLPSAANASDLGPFSYFPELRYDLREAAFTIRDLDGNGILDIEEVRLSIQASFMLIDMDSDNNISKFERAAYTNSFTDDYRILFGEERDTFILRRSKSLNTMDDNNNGEISWPEFTQYYQYRFERMDNNMDNVIGRDEYRLDIEKAALYNVDTTP